jgi:hypothetical protein
MIDPGADVKAGAFLKTGKRSGKISPSPPKKKKKKIVF